jgi:hypothetical protein
MYYSKNVLGVYFVKYFQAFLAVFMAKSVGKWPFWLLFCIFWVALKAYLISLTPHTPTPGLGWALPPQIVGAPSSS